MRPWLLVLCACGSSPRAEPVEPPTYVPADAAINADAFVTKLIPSDAPRLVVTASDGCGYVLERVYFAPNSSAIQPHQRPAADATAAILACVTKDDASIAKLEVQGHADATERDPLRLSEERAVRLANHLAANGVSAKILVVRGYGAAFPLDRRKTAAARAKNRRVDFVILERRLD